MVKRCVVQFCSNTIKTGYSVHEFPRDEVLRQRWVKFVQVKRVNFTDSAGLTKTPSYICGAHFSYDCFEGGLMRPMGVAMKGLLKKGAVPTVQSIRTDVRRCGNPKRPAVDDSETAVAPGPNVTIPPRITSSSNGVCNMEKVCIQ
jgi:hypothetical protein